MERVNFRTLSVFVIFCVLFSGLFCVEVAAGPNEEQKENSNSQCPGVNVGGKTITTALPSGPFLRVEGVGVELNIPGQSLSGEFAFEQQSSPKVSGVSLGDEGKVSSESILQGGVGDDRFLNSVALPAGPFVRVEGPELDVFGQGLSGNFSFEQMTESGGGEIIIGGEPVSLDLPAGPFVRVEGVGIGLDIAGQSLSGSFSFERVTSEWRSSLVGSGTGNMYISAAYGTVHSDTRVCEIGRGYFARVLSGQGSMESLGPKSSENSPQPFVLPGLGGNDKPGRHLLGNPYDNPVYWENISPSLGGHTGPHDGSDFLSLSSPYSTQKGARTIQPELSLHYDSGKADGSVDERQTVLGYGWTHNYNIYLIDRSPDIYMADGKGRMTRFQEDGFGGYTVSDGQTHSLIYGGPDFFYVEEIDGTMMAFQLALPSPMWAGGEKIYLLVGIQDASGRIFELGYNMDSLLETITDPYGREVEFGYVSYPAGPRLQYITDPNMQTTIIGYDPAGEQLKYFTDPLGHAINYVYDSNNCMTSALLKDGNTWHCDYSGGKPWRIRDPNGDTYATVTNTENWALDPVHLANNEIRYYASVSTITDGEGNVTTLNLDQNGYVTALSHPGESGRSFSYNADLRLINVTDEVGNMWTYGYDSNGNLTDIDDPLYNYSDMFYEDMNNPSMVTKIIEPDGDTWEFEYDLSGNLTKIIDPIVELPTDKVMSYDYSYLAGPPFGILESITETDRNGHTVEWEYDPNGNIVREVVDPCGVELVTEYEYDCIGRMTKRSVLVEPSPAKRLVTTYSYDRLGRVVRTEVDPNNFNLRTEYEYDGCGRLTRVSNRRGIFADYDYDERGRLAERTFDPCDLALSSNYSYDGCDRRIRTIDAKGNQTNYEYDSLNRLIKIVDANGYRTEYEYEARSNLTEVKRTIEPGGGGYRISDYEYDPLNRLVRITGDPCDLAAVTQIEYATGGDGTPGTLLVHKITDAEGKVVYYYYDKLDRLIRVVGKVGDTGDNGGDPNDAISDYEYDSVGNIIRLTIENAPEPNLVTEYSYDGANRLVQRTDSPDDANLITNYSYDGVGNVIGEVTPVGNIINYSYDSASRLVSISDSIGTVVSYGYDENNNILSATDGLGHSWNYSYDNADRVTDVCDPLIEAGTDKYARYEYDENGNIIRITDNEGVITDYEYDPLNRLIKTSKDPGGLDITATMGYDGSGNKTEAFDDKGNVTIYEYDGLNRLIREEFADLTEMVFSYDGVGNLISETDQMGNVTGYSYDDLNRLVRRSYATGGEDSFGYDRASQVISADNEHSHIGYSYDGAGRIIGSLQTDEVPTYIYGVSYGYSAEPNNTRTINYPDGTEVIEIYDVRDRLVEVRREGSMVALYSYENPTDRLLSKELANGTQTQYSYNENDWVTEIRHVGADGLTTFAGFSYAYDGVGNCIRATNLQLYSPNKPVTESMQYSYDSVYRLTQFKRGLMLGDQIPIPTRERNWMFDDAGNWEQFSIEDTLNPIENGGYANSVNQMNEYDDFSTNGAGPIPDDDGQPDDFMVNSNPLTGDFQPDGEVDFNDLAVLALSWLDECSGPGWCSGADIDQSQDVNFVDFGFLADNWLDSSSGFYNSGHDKNGNLVDDDVLEYYWDGDHLPIEMANLRARNLLTQVRRKSDGYIAGQYSYDAFGRRIEKNVDGLQTVYVYDGWRVIEEYDDGLSAHSFVYGDELDEVLVMLDGAVLPSYYHAENIGSTIAITDAVGVFSEGYAYDAYGQPYFFGADGNEIGESVIENAYLFTGRRYDEETGLYYYRTRYLQPKRGRFISGDAIGNWGDPMNLGNGYTYAGNNPASYIDPFGLQAGVKFGPPKGRERRRYNFRFKASSVRGIRKANILISLKDALSLKKTDAAAQVLRRCKVIIVSGGWVCGKKG